MKRVLIILIIFTNLACFSQSIRINTTTYTTEQLINDVLINSPCVFARNYNSKTGTSFGSSNGIGYFENTNPNFPFKRGVVLSTGDVTKAQAPNNTILSDGNSSWKGDTDLENILLSQSGIKMKSINASFIEFEFTPKSSNFDFSFLFASEEYGTAQCNYSDAFAFLLQDVTSGTLAKNLALVPNTNIPVTVQTIRDSANNSGCPSANISYFGSFNGEGFGPAINFNGQTVRMVASATGLDINHTYRIKLVIADGGNNTEYDSAIFIEGNSFNVGQNVLGLDYLAENKRAFCPGDSLPTLSALGLKPGTTFVWQKDGVSFTPEQTGAVLNLNTVDPTLISGIHNYSVIYYEPSCKGITDSIAVEIYPKLDVMTNVPDMYSCDITNGITKFDLSKNTNIILAATNLKPETIISYHLTKSNAELNTEPLTNTYSITKVEDGKIIYARIRNVVSQCYEIRSFKLMSNDLKIQAIPAPETLCARSFDEIILKANFNLLDQKSLILGNLPPDLNKITFHRSQSDANTNTKSIVLNSGQLLSPTQTIWARLQNIANPSCFQITSFDLIVKPIPDVDNLEDVYVCDSFVLPKLKVEGAQYWTRANGKGIQLFAGDTITITSVIYTYIYSGGCPNQHSFKVTIIKLDEMAPNSVTYCSEYTLPKLPYGRYFTLSGGIYTRGNVELFAGNSISTIGKKTVYVWYEDLTQIPACIKEISFDITIITWEELPKYEDKFDCTAYTLPEDPNGGIYYSGPKKQLPIIPPGTIITKTTTIYIYKENKKEIPTYNCKSEESFTIQIGLNSMASIVDIEVCSSYKVPTFKTGEFRTAPDGGGSRIEPGTIFTETTQIWYYIKGQSCTDKLNFTVTITKDIMPEMPNVTECNIYYLPQISFLGDYFSEPSGAGQLYPVGTPIIKSQRIYFYDKFSTNVCNAKRGFQVTITPSTKLDAKPVEVLICGKSYILDDLKNGEYYEFPGGPSATNPVLNPGFEIKSSQTIYAFAPEQPNISCKAEYSISIVITKVNPIPNQFACTSYNLPKIVGQGDYYTEQNGPNGTGKKLSFPYEPITATTRLYVYADNDNRINCFDEKSFLITIQNLKIEPINPIKVCDSYKLPNLVAPATKYFKKEGGPSATNTEIFPNDIITKTTTIYAYAEIGTTETVKCYDEKPFEITIVPKPKPELTIPTICVDTETNIVSNAIIYSGYDLTKYTFEWKKDDGTLLSTNPDFSTNAIGNYTFQVNDIRINEGCLSEKSIFSLLYSSGPKEVTYTTSEWFSENQTITVNAISFPGYSNNFSYSLNGGVPQTSNTFTNLEGGTHEITVTDANLCGNYNTISFEIKFPFYPKFFTPNGDGFNDNWKINKFENLSTYKIYIYDRYGKLVKEILSDKDQWDGNYKGKPLPPDDYWFTISYTLNNTQKMFKSHFSLIR